MREFTPVIGLEIHAQLLTETKMFCSCRVSFGSEPNTQICPVCLGLPGALPVVNEKAVALGLRLGLAVHSEIQKRNTFARKNYFYPDCPKNYQISQYEEPLCRGGFLTINGRRVGIERIHLEEDAGRLIHNRVEECSYVDMNRCGIPLAEVVTEPDIRTPEEASLFVRKLRALLRYLDVCDGNMQEGSLRCDVNVSLRGRPGGTLAVKTEIKNLNSFKAIEKALAVEIARQEGLLSTGLGVDRVTLLWDAAEDQLQVMRSKEEAHDYRYFPEPDLMPQIIPQSLIEKIRKKLPELPDAKRERFMRQYELPEYDAEVLTESKEIADFFEDVARSAGNAKTVSNWIMRDVMQELNERNMDLRALGIRSADLGELIAAVEGGRINMRAAKKVFKEMLESAKSLSAVIEEYGLEQISSREDLEKVVEKVLQEHPAEKAQGKDKTAGVLYGAGHA
jgi:aspartyl-tRNA(Asn)/glutamyl-tRNA(Gln) amidotransferase subunit B